MTKKAMWPHEPVAWARHYAHWKGRRFVEQDDVTLALIWFGVGCFSYSAPVLWGKSVREWESFLIGMPSQEWMA